MHRTRIAAALLAVALLSTPGVAHAAAPTTTATYTADLGTVFTNPERGFHNRYEIVDDPAVNDYASNTIPGFNPDMLDRTFARAKANGNTLIHSYLHLDKYQTADLPPALMTNLGTGLAAIRAQGMKIVLRVAYVWDGYSAVTEPQMERHIDQLAPVLAANADVILHLEAGFFGAWGEWHSSPYTASSEESQAPVRYRLVKKLLSSTPATMPIAIRYPIFNYEFAQRTTPPPGCPLPDNCLMTTQDKDRLGFHDDCFLADTADMGTYDQNSWLGWFDVSVKKQWVYDMATSAGGNKMIGGETCNASGANDSAGVNAQYELSHQHWTEINEDYAPVNTDIWKAAHLAASGNDPAETLFTRIERKLGYRLRLQDATYTTQAVAGSPFTFAAHLTNDGYAGIIRPRPVFLVFDNGTQRYNVPLPGLDPRTWRPGAVTVPTQTVTLPSMTAGTYKLALWLPDQATGLRGNPAYSVRLANTGTWDATKGYNVLAGAIQVGSCTADCVPPTAPTLTSTGTTATSASLSWTGATDNVGVTGYTVFRDGTQVATVSGTSYTDTGVPAGSHTYTVTARDAAGNVSVPSNAVTVGVGCTDCAPPSTPAGLAVTGTATTSISLAWNPSTDNVGVTGYLVFRDGTQVGTPTGTAYTDGGLSAGSYTYTVRSRDAAGNLSPASAPLTASTAPPTPAGLVVDDYDGTPAYPSAAKNDLGKWTGGNCFINGGGNGAVDGGALTLQYNNCGWFGSDVGVDVSTRTYLVVRIKGTSPAHFNLSLGGTTKVFADYTLDGGGHPALTGAFQDIKIPLVANGINRANPAQLAMGFWYGGSGTVTIDSISFV